MDATLELIRRRLCAHGSYLRERDLLPLLPFSRSTLLRKVRQENFPQPVSLGPRIRAWRAEDVIEWFSKLEGAAR